MGSEPLPKEGASVFYVYAGEELALSERLRVKHYRPATVDDITDAMVETAARAHVVQMGLGVGDLDDEDRDMARVILEAVFRGD